MRKYVDYHRCIKKIKRKSDIVNIKRSEFSNFINMYREIYLFTSKYFYKIA